MTAKPKLRGDIKITRLFGNSYRLQVGIELPYDFECESDEVLDIMIAAYSEYQRPIVTNDIFQAQVGDDPEPTPYEIAMMREIKNPGTQDIAWGGGSRIALTALQERGLVTGDPDRQLTEEGERVYRNLPDDV